MTLDLPTEAATVALAEQLVAALPADWSGLTVLLEGELGSGKSTLARAVIRSLGYEGPVPSPTYTLVEPYELQGGRVYHVDLYRVSAPEELRFLGFSELDDGLRLVEWPDRAAELAATADLKIELRYAGEGRSASIVPLSPRGQPLVAALEAAQTS